MNTKRLIDNIFPLLAVVCLLGRSLPVAAQPLSAAQEREFAKREDSLKGFAFKIVNDSLPAGRFRADSQFVRSLVRSLKIPNSFEYPFDSLETISRLYAPDSSFRILTWQFKKDDYMFLQEGAIQMRTADGSLKLFPLFDVSMFTERAMDSVRTNRNWIGAIYYRIIEKSWQGKNYYTLLGFDDFSQSSNKKWMEVLTFGSDGAPRFGGPFFSYMEDSIRKPTQFRFNIEYKKEAGTRFNYDSELGMVVYDHLVPEGDEPKKKDTYVPDGDFEAFQWKEGKWVHVQRSLFNFKLKDGQFPQEAKLLDEQGKVNEVQLEQQSEKNVKKKKPN
ncbi:MAG TPA: hypothetical protein VGM89_14000 [Puia sp.]|jgi:hypothetical protein